MKDFVIAFFISNFKSNSFLPRLFADHLLWKSQIPKIPFPPSFLLNSRLWIFYSAHTGSVIVKGENWTYLNQAAMRTCFWWPIVAIHFKYRQKISHVRHVRVHFDRQWWIPRNDVRVNCPYERLPPLYPDPPHIANYQQRSFKITRNLVVVWTQTHVKKTKNKNPLMSIKVIL